jgi:hypothetical protein
MTQQTNGCGGQGVASKGDARSRTRLGRAAAARPSRPAGAAQTPASGDVQRERAARRQAGLIVIAIVVVVAVACGVAWWTLRASTGNAGRAETEALLARIEVIRSTITPIAQDYTSADQSAPIDVTSFRDRVQRAREVVIAVNDVSVSSTEGIQARDEILTGGSMILDGLEMALDALESDDAAATDQAAAQVDEGLALLDTAQQELEAKAKANGWQP